MGARSGRGPTSSRAREAAAQEASPREIAVRSYLHRWAETAGVQLLVVDPADGDADLVDAMAGRGVHLTWVSSTVDALIQFGRLDPHVVVVTPEVPGVTAEEFVAAIKRHGASYVVAGLQRTRAADVGELMLAGASGVVTRPYTPEHLWQLVSQVPRALDDHAHLEVGPLELDASAYLVRVDGERVADLPLKEFELLRVLMTKAPGLVTDDEVRAALWGTEGDRPSGNTIAMHVTRLRHRLEGAATVRRIRGRGYSLEVD